MVEFGRKPKRISRQGIAGQKGINKIERVVLDMGCRWTQSGANEVGIDGYIELFDPSNQTPLGTTLAVQSKALSDFQNETTETFDYWCDKSDIEYWSNSNIPVILIVSRLNSDESYWAPVKEYFAKSEFKSSPRIRFTKSTQEFSPSCLPKLAKLAVSRDIGFYLPPLAKSEKIYSNLLSVLSFPSTIWVAKTTFRKPTEVWARLRENATELSSAWILHDKGIISFENLCEDPWLEVCDLGTAEDFAVREWADSEDPDRSRQFVQLMNHTLKDQLYPKIKFWPREECYAWAGCHEMKVAYQSAKRKSKVTAVGKYTSKSSDGREFVYYRHLAFRGFFKRIGLKWYLELTPTYRFTRDGMLLDRFHEERLKRIKAFEGNRAVLSAVLFWAAQLSSNETLFQRRTLQLVFDKLATFDMPVSINDKSWSLQNEDQPRSAKRADLELLLPLDDLDDTT